MFSAIMWLDLELRDRIRLIHIESLADAVHVSAKYAANGTRHPDGDWIMPPMSNGEIEKEIRTLHASGLFPELEATQHGLGIWVVRIQQRYQLPTSCSPGGRDSLR
jgi:hypothetical protein